MGAVSFIHADSYLLDENMKCLWGVNKFRVRPEPLYSVLVQAMSMCTPMVASCNAFGHWNHHYLRSVVLQVGDVINPGNVTAKTLRRGAVLKASMGVEHVFLPELRSAPLYLDLCD